MKTIYLNLLALIAVTFLGACKQTVSQSGGLPDRVVPGSSEASESAKLPAPRPQLEGAGSTGGGDIDGIFRAEQDRYRKKFAESVHEMVHDLIGKDRIRHRLSAFLKVVHADTNYDRYRLRNRELVAYLQKYTGGALIQDVAEAKYDFRERCEDSSGIERGLSTAKGNALAPLVGSAICVNVRKIEDDILTRRIPRRDIASYLVGLFLHDHLRHFGVEDEDHGLAEAFRLSYAKFQQIVYVPTPELDETYTQSKARADAKYYYFAFFPQESDNSEHVDASPSRPIKLTLKQHPELTLTGVEYLLVKPDDHHKKMLDEYNYNDKLTRDDFRWNTNVYKIPRVVPGQTIEMDLKDWVIWGSNSLFSVIQPYIEYERVRRGDKYRVTDYLADGFLARTENNWTELVTKYPHEVVFLSLEIRDQDDVLIEDLPLFYSAKDPFKEGEYRWNWSFPEIEFGWKTP